jgi:hypothetical protein
VDTMGLWQRFLCQYVALTVPIILYTHLSSGTCHSMRGLLLHFFLCFVITVLERDYFSDYVLSLFCRAVYSLSLVKLFLLMLSENAGMSLTSYKLCFTLFRQMIHIGL